MSSMSNPPPAPPDPPAAQQAPSTPAAPTPPTVPTTGPDRAYRVELLVYPGGIWNDHWGFWIPSHTNPNFGMFVHATGSVSEGFRIEVKRGYNITKTTRAPNRIPLQWVDGSYFDENAIYNNEQLKLDETPRTLFEYIARKIEPPKKSLSAATGPAHTSELRDCQTWVVEASGQLFAEKVFTEEVLKYLKKKQQRSPKGHS